MTARTKITRRKRSSAEVNPYEWVGTSVARFDSGSHSSFITEAAMDEMLRRGAAYADMITVGKPRRWSGFTDSTEQLQNNSSACRSVQFLKGKKPTARMKVPCQIVPPMVLLLGRGLLLADIEPRIDPLLGPMVDGISHPAPY